MDRRTLRRPSGIAASPGSVVVALQSPRNSTSGFTRSLICTPRQLLRVHGLSLALAPLPTRYMPAMLSLMITRSLLPFTRSRQHSGTRSESAGRRADPLYASRARGVGGLHARQPGRPGGDRRSEGLLREGAGGAGWSAEAHPDLSYQPFTSESCGAWDPGACPDSGEVTKAAGRP